VTSRIAHTTVDARDSHAQSRWWARVLDWTEDPDDKVVKNRLHLDLRPVDGTREEEVARLVALGAEQLGDFRRPDGTGWITLADPEGNEFCVLSPGP
jgi:hypothetical protein